MRNTCLPRTHLSCWLAACLAALLALSAITANASVVIKRFEATAQTDNSILVAWETAVEFDTQGFNLYRALAETGPWDPDHIVNQQAAQGSGFTGAVYEYSDTHVTPGVRYYYLLEELTSSGVGQHAGPISAGIGLEPEPTATATETLTPSATLSPTASATPTATATFKPTIYLPLIVR